MSIDNWNLLVDRTPFELRRCFICEVRSNTRVYHVNLLYEFILKWCIIVLLSNWRCTFRIWAMTFKPSSEWLAKILLVKAKVFKYSCGSWWEWNTASYSSGHRERVFWGWYANRATNIAWVRQQYLAFNQERVKHIWLRWETIWGRQEGWDTCQKHPVSLKFRRLHNRREG